MKLMKLASLVALIAVASAQDDEKACIYDSNCDNGYCRPDVMLCEPFKNEGEICDAVMHCGPEHVCDDGICSTAHGGGCDGQADCNEGEYCDLFARQCYSTACSYDSDCASYHYCHEETCVLRPVVGETCGGEAPFVPCAEPLRCKSGVCTRSEESFQVPCSVLDTCSDCHEHSEGRCVWAGRKCRSCKGPACASADDICQAEEEAHEEEGHEEEGHEEEDVPVVGTTFGMYACTRDLDCPDMEYCHNGDPRYEGTGRCAPIAKEGELCGGVGQTAAVPCIKGYSCVFDGSDTQEGICVVNDELAGPGPRDPVVVVEEPAYWPFTRPLLRRPTNRVIRLPIYQQPVYQPVDQVPSNSFGSKIYTTSPAGTVASRSTAPLYSTRPASSRSTAPLYSSTRPGLGAVGPKIRFARPGHF